MSDEQKRADAALLAACRLTLCVVECLPPYLHYYCALLPPLILFLLLWPVVSHFTSLQLHLCAPLSILPSEACHSLVRFLGNGASQWEMLRRS